MKEQANQEDVKVEQEAKPDQCRLTLDHLGRVWDGGKWWGWWEYDVYGGDFIIRMTPSYRL